jgi:hypothetical protein
MHRALFALWFVAACAPQTSPSDPSTTEPTATPSDPAPGEPTPKHVRDAELDLFGVMQTHEGLTLQLRSGGCRHEGGVDFGVADEALVITRLEEENCEALMPLGEQVAFVWDKLPAFQKFGFSTAAVPVLEPGTKAGATKAVAGGEEEHIYGVLVTSDGLDIRVFSSGCTGEANFTSWIEPGDIERVHLIRTKLDQCEADIPEGVVLHFTWAQLGVTKQQAQLVNPILKAPLQ